MTTMGRWLEIPCSVYVAVPASRVERAPKELRLPAVRLQPGETKTVRWTSRSKISRIMTTIRLDGELTKLYLIVGQHSLDDQAHGRSLRSFQRSQTNNISSNRMSKQRSGLVSHLGPRSANNNDPDKLVAAGPHCKAARTQPWIIQY